MKRLMKYYLLSATALYFLFGLLSCSPMDSYKQYIRDGEITYTSKADSLIIHSGKNRVLVEGFLKGAPKAVEARIYWSSGNDSVVTPIIHKGRKVTFQNILTIWMGECIVW